jgi:threonine synthase
LIGIIKAFDELLQQGFIRKVPHFVGVQAEGCSPIARAFQDNKSRVERIKKAETIAKAIANPDPPGGNHVLRMIKRTGGTMLSAPDEKILEAQRILSAYEGIFVQPASATVLAGLLEFTERQTINSKAKVVLILTGSGMKALGNISLQDAQVKRANIPDLPSILKSA